MMRLGRKNPEYQRCAVHDSRRYIFQVLTLSGCIIFTGCHYNLRRGDKVRELPHKPLTSNQKADIQVALGRSAESRGDSEAAAKAYLEALSNDNDLAEAHHRLALLRDKQGRSSEATKLYIQALSHAPNSPEIHCNLGYNYYLQERFQLAEASLRKATELRPDFAKARNNLGMLLARTGRADEALDAFASAGLTESQARMNLAFAMMMRSDIESAERQVQLAKAVGARGKEGERIAEFERTLLKGRIASAGGQTVDVASHSQNSVAKHLGPAVANSQILNPNESVRTVGFNNDQQRIAELERLIRKRQMAQNPNRPPRLASRSGTRKVAPPPKKVPSSEIQSENPDVYGQYVVSPDVLASVTDPDTPLGRNLKKPVEPKNVVLRRQSGQEVRRLPDEY